MPNVDALDFVGEIFGGMNPPHVELFLYTLENTSRIYDHMNMNLHWLDRSCWVAAASTLGLWTVLLKIIRLKHETQ